MVDTTSADDSGFGETDVSVEDNDFTVITSKDFGNSKDGSIFVNDGPGKFRLDIFTFKQSYKIVVEDCLAELPAQPADPTTPDKPGDTSNPDDVVDGTTPDKPLPDTGGLPLAGLVVIGLALVSVGVSIVRAGAERRS